MRQNKDDKLAGWFTRVLLALIVCAVAILPACFGGGGGESFAGAATIRGTVTEFDTMTAMWLPQERKSGPMRILDEAMELLVPSARAMIEGVLVEVAGTDLATTTDENGFFIISGVPPGDHEIIFTFRGESAVWPQEIPANAEVEMRDIRIDNDTIAVDEVTVDVPGDKNLDKSNSENNAIRIRNKDGVSDDHSVDVMSTNVMSTDVMSTDGMSTDGMSTVE